MLFGIAIRLSNDAFNRLEQKCHLGYFKHITTYGNKLIYSLSHTIKNALNGMDLDLRL